MSLTRIIDDVHVVDPSAPSGTQSPFWVVAIIVCTVHNEHLGYFFAPAFAARRAAQYFFIRALTALRAAADIDLRLRPRRLPAALALVAALSSSGNAFRIA